MAVRAAVIYYSSTGTTYELARAVADGAQQAGAEVRLRRVPEIAPQSSIDTNPQWREHLRATREVPEASLDDLVWADAVFLGTPTRFGNVSAQLKNFIDRSGGLWAEGKLADKVVSGFVTVATQHGGHETTLLALYNSMYHWGAIIVPPGYTAPIQFATGNPYGVSHTSVNATQMPTETELEAGRYLARRAVGIAERLVPVTREPEPVDAPEAQDVQRAHSAV
jgi:NAD(P)H dehydrogenase (quinone)